MQVLQLAFIDGLRTVHDWHTHAAPPPAGRGVPHAVHAPLASVFRSVHAAQLHAARARLAGSRDVKTTTRSTRGAQRTVACQVQGWNAYLQKKRMAPAQARRRADRLLLPSPCAWTRTRRTPTTATRSSACTVGTAMVRWTSSEIHLSRCLVVIALVLNQWWHGAASAAQPRDRPRVSPGQLQCFGDPINLNKAATLTRARPVDTVSDIGDVSLTAIPADGTRAARNGVQGEGPLEQAPERVQRD